MIFAIDFDGTIVEHEYPNIGKMRRYADQVIRDLKREEHSIIIWTCRCGSDLAEAIYWLHANEIPFDTVNANAVPATGYAVPKVVADVYVDDRSFPPFTSWLSLAETYMPKLYGAKAEHRHPVTGGKTLMQVYEELDA